MPNVLSVAFGREEISLYCSLEMLAVTDLLRRSVTRALGQNGIALIA